MAIVSRARNAIRERKQVMPTVDERHYRVGELATLWRLSRRTITRIFEREEGVLRWGYNSDDDYTDLRSRRRRRRRYVTLSIPESVAMRVKARLGGLDSE